MPATQTDTELGQLISAAVKFRESGNKYDEHALSEALFTYLDTVAYQASAENYRDDCRHETGFDPDGGYPSDRRYVRSCERSDNAVYTVLS